MMSRTTARGLLGHFSHGLDLPTVNQRASLPPVRSPTSLSLQEILAAGAGGEEDRRAARADARTEGMAEVGVGEQGGEPGTDGGAKFKRAGEARGIVEAK